MQTARTYYRLAAAVALGTALFLVWMIGALGVIGPGGPPDLMYVGVTALGVVGAVLVRLRPRGMARVMAATALALVVVAVVAIAAGLQDVEGASVAEILGLTAMYVVPCALSAWLFRAAEKSSSVAATDRR